MADLNALEREVEQARARLVSDIERLRDPQTLTAARGELTSYREAATERAREAAASKSSLVLEEIRSRVEANPVAALVLGAGVAWKVLRDPPIGALLFFGGLASLINTKPPQTGSRHPTTDAILAARERATESVRGASAAAADLRQQIVAQARETAGQASSQAAALVEDARETFSRAASEATVRASALGDQASAYASRANRAARETYQAYPLAMAAAAVGLGVALGLATGRRSENG